MSAREDQSGTSPTRERGGSWSAQGCHLEDPPPRAAWGRCPSLRGRWGPDHPGPHHARGGPHTRERYTDGGTSCRMQPAPTVRVLRTRPPPPLARGRSAEARAGGAQRRGEDRPVRGKHPGRSSPTRSVGEVPESSRAVGARPWARAAVPDEVARGREAARRRIATACAVHEREEDPHRPRAAHAATSPADAGEVRRRAEEVRTDGLPIRANEPCSLVPLRCFETITRSAHAPNMI
jgi:hypothetical protein